MSEKEKKQRKKDSREPGESSSKGETQQPAREEVVTQEDKEVRRLAQEEEVVDQKRKEQVEGISDQPTAVLGGLFGFKMGMASAYTDKGVQIPVTVLKVKPWTITQIKTRETDCYDAVQVSLLEKAEKNVNRAEKGHLKKVSSEKGALFTREIRGPVPKGIQVGQKVDVSSFERGLKLKITTRSKGRGFAGTVKRFNFGGGPAAHGSTFHRQPGSVGNRTWPGRIIPGKKLPGHFGHETVTVKNVEVIDVQVEEGLVLVKGPVPGPPKGLVKMLKQ